MSTKNTFVTIVYNFTLWKDILLGLCSLNNNLLDSLSLYPFRVKLTDRSKAVNGAVLAERP